MKNKILCFLLLSVLLLSVLAGCANSENVNGSSSENNPLQPSVSNDNTLNTTEFSHAITTTAEANAGENSNGAENDDNTVTFSVPDGLDEPEDDYGYSASNGELYIKAISLESLPMSLECNGNKVIVEKAGLLNGDVNNPLFILVKNTGDDGIYSATFTASAGEKSILFTASFIPAKASIWVENISKYTYSEGDDFKLNTDCAIVSSTDAGIPIESMYAGILEIYQGTQNGSRGVFVKNISGKNLSGAVIKYRSKAGNTGLFSAPYEINISSFADGNTIFKSNSYIYDVEIDDVQIYF